MKTKMPSNPQLKATALKIAALLQLLALVVIVNCSLNVVKQIKLLINYWHWLVSSAL